MTLTDKVIKEIIERKMVINSKYTDEYINKMIKRRINKVTTKKDIIYFDNKIVSINDIHTLDEITLLYKLLFY